MSLSISCQTLQLRYHATEGIRLTEKSSGQTWVWPVQTLGAVKVETDPGNAAPSSSNRFNGLDRIELVQTDTWRIDAVDTADNSLRIQLSGQESIIEQVWSLEATGVTVITEVKAWDYSNPEVRLVSPGILHSGNGASPAVLPIYQGIVHHQGDYAALIAPGSHGRYQLGFSGLLGKDGALSAIVDLNWDYELYIRATSNLEDQIAYVPRTTFGEYAASYTTYFKICNSTVFDLAQTYRSFKIARGEFVTWEEKLEKTPGLVKMFGAPHFFIGYHESNHDYIGALKQAKEMGFENAFVYPTTFRSYNPEMELMDGVHWIDISAIHEDIKALDYHISPWSWCEEVSIQSKSDRGVWAILGVNEKGKYNGGWATGDYQWYTVAGDAQVQFMRWAQDNMWPELTAQHFDVTGNLVFPHIYGQKKFDRAADVECRRDVLEQAAIKGPVSTEGFCDGFQQSIHCGSVMAFPSWGERDWWTVPLNAIIFHDSAMNVWWECDSYNNPHHQTQHHRDKHVAPAGGGKPVEQSLWDALQGSPPNIFLCGKMYRPADGVHFSKGYTFYDVQIEDELTQQALKLAKPVADLHRKIGKQRIVSYEILTADGQVQRSTYRDGTTVTVNFGQTSWSDGTRTYDAESWSVH
ncbi:hypothetical protein [Paenibacillus silvisoli]|uniref:hypothetical protein n=1 Tax=Paenibacillus silvisoli TaxID=3110539 RepID=UPI0028046840|nr:hypothetical protein [Paenibacillus silvisoli]